MPRNLLSQLGHVELLSPRPQESVDFAQDILGLEESHRERQSVWLRGWGEHHHHSLVITRRTPPPSATLAGGRTARRSSTWRWPTWRPPATESGGWRTRSVTARRTGSGHLRGM